MRHAQRLQVCVGHYELDALHAGINHAIDRVVAASTHTRAFLAPGELDVRRESSRSRLRTPARQGRLAFLPEALAMTGAPDSATSIRRYREALANETRHHLAPYPPGIVQAFPNDAN